MPKKVVNRYSIALNDTGQCQAMHKNAKRQRITRNDTRCLLVHFTTATKELYYCQRQRITRNDIRSCPFLRLQEEATAKRCSTTAITHLTTAKNTLLQQQTHLPQQHALRTLLQQHALHYSNKHTLLQQQMHLPQQYALYYNHKRTFLQQQKHFTTATKALYYSNNALVVRASHTKEDLFSLYNRCRESPGSKEHRRRHTSTLHSIPRTRCRNLK